MRTFSEAIRVRGFAISAELPLTPLSSEKSILEQASILSPVVDAIQVPDNRFGHLHMSSLAAAAILLRNGMDPLTELGCRNRNRVALIGDILGARALGVTSLLMIRGKKAPDEIKPSSKGKRKMVLDVGVKDLIGIAKTINEDKKLPAAPGFMIGATVAAHDPKYNWNPERLNARIDSGVQFVQTQLCLDINVLRRYMRHLVSTKIIRRVNIVVATAPLLSAEIARHRRENQPHVLIPDETIARLSQAQNPAKEGINICAEFLSEAKEIPGVSGISLSSTGDLDAIPAVLDSADMIDCSSPKISRKR